MTRRPHRCAHFDGRCSWALTYRDGARRREAILKQCREGIAARRARQEQIAAELVEAKERAS